VSVCMSPYGMRAPGLAVKVADAKSHACMHTHTLAKQGTPICGSGHGTPGVQVSKSAWLSLFQKGKRAILRRAESGTDSTHELQQLLDVQGLPPTAYADGESLLCLAASHGDVACVELLYQRGGNLNEAQPQGQTNVTAIEIASWMGHEPVVDFLLAHGAFFGRALHYAAKAGHSALAQRLLDCHAHPEMPVDGRSPLMIAVLAQNDDVIEKLVRAGAKVCADFCLKMGAKKCHLGHARSHAVL